MYKPKWKIDECEDGSFGIEIGGVLAYQNGIKNVPRKAL